MDIDKCKEIARAIIQALSNRGGFDGWWDDIDEDIQEDVIGEVAEIIFEGKVGL